jgi:ParB family chromosome partitioning protein
MLVGQPNADELADEIINRGLNVRQVEAMARKDGKAQAQALKPKRRGGKDADTVALEKRVSDALGLQVSIDHRGKWGILHIHYRDLDQLDVVLRKLEGL